MTQGDARANADGPGDDEEIASLFSRLPDVDARTALAERFESLARYLASRFTGRGEPLEDLNQVASIGLLKAIDRFDPTREVRFTTYAAATIVGELKRHFRDKGWAMKVPRRLQELALRLNPTIEQLSGQLGRSPSIPELAERLEVEPEDIVEAMDAAQAYSTASLDAPAGESGLAPVDTLGDEDEMLELAHEWAVVSPALKRLPDRERRVLYLRFFRGMTQSEIAGAIGVSQMHVSRILTTTIERLRSEVQAEPQPLE